MEWTYCLKFGDEIGYEGPYSEAELRERLDSYRQSYDSYDAMADNVEWIRVWEQMERAAGPTDLSLSLFLDPE